MALQSLKKRYEFLALRDKGIKIVRSDFILQGRQARSDQQSHYGLTASKKIGNAVRRNKARRRLRALARLHLSQKAQAGWHYGLIARYDCVDTPWADLESAFIAAIDKLHAKADQKKENPKESRSSS